MPKPEVRAFFDEATFTVTYVVSDPDTGHAAIIDPVLDFDPASGRTSTSSADEVVAYVEGNELEIDWILESHVHADHLSGAPYLKQFDHLFTDGESFKVGDLDAQALATPGHTPACITYVIGDMAFVGDTLFMPDFGSARTDFPGGSGRDEFAWETTVAEQRASNIHISDEVSRDDFVAMREGRDAQLGMPKLILPALQVNLRAGQLPDPEDNDIRYLKIPLDAV
jgi:glyoxylase-like metal-dependent hydrolase (beta-lactamase superfamily II)